MKQKQFEQLYAPVWQHFEQQLQGLEISPRRVPREGASENADEFASHYRRVCHFHAVAKERNYSSYLVDQLSDLVLRGHRQLYRRRSAYFRDFLHFFVVEFPCVVRAEQKYFWWASAVFYVPTLIMLLAVWLMPELVYTIMGPESVMHMEDMYNPEHKVIGSAREATTNWYMFGYYINNNISVAFRTFASGLLWGLGSLFFLIYNGLLFGAVSAHMINLTYIDTFFTFVIGHGSFELTAIVISGAAGLKLGMSLLFPGPLTRKVALLAAAKVAIKLIYGVIFMLVIAAFIEAFWSSNNVFMHWQKYLVGASLWLVVAGYLIFGGRRFGS